MKNTKITLEKFAFCDHAAIRRRMEDMATMGWLVEKPGNVFWKFRRIEPKKLTFAVTYFADASEFDPAPTDGQQTMAEFCAKHGWTLAAQYGKMQIFYNENESPIPIETDPVTQVETIHRSMKKSLLPSHLMLLALCVCQLVFMGLQLHSSPVEFLSTPSSLYLALMWVMLTASTVCEISAYFFWHRKAKQAAESGVFYEGKLSHAVSWIFLALGLLAILFSLAGSATFWWATLLWAGVVVFVGIAVRAIRNVLRKKGAGRALNRAVTIGTSIALTMLFMALFIFTILRFGLPRDSSAVGSYDVGGWTFEVYDDPMPLYSEDLIEFPANIRWSRRRQHNSTFLLSGTEYYQRALSNDSSLPLLEYTVTEVKSTWLYDFCKNGLLNARHDRYFDNGEVFTDHYEPIDAASWGAKEAYQQHWSSSVLNKYLLCYENRLVELSLDFEPTAKQKATVKEKLGG